MPESRQSADGELRTQTVCLMVLAAVAAGAALYWLRPVLLPFVLAVFFVCGVAPVLELIERRLHAPPLLAVAIAFLFGLAALALLWTLVWLSVASLLNNADTYRDRFGELVAYVSEWVDVPQSPFRSERQPPAGETSPFESEELSALARQQFRAWLTQLSGALMDILSSALMVLIFMFFLLLGGTSQSVPRTGVWNEIQLNIRGYIVTKTIISAVTGGVFGLVLWLFGIPLALLFGLLAFLLNFIPNIGPIIASLLPLPLIVLHPDLSVTAMIAVIALSGAVQFISGNLVEPKIMGDSFELHPVAILLTLMFWGMIWGIVGMFLATPITAAMKILFEKFDHTRPIAQLLAGRMDQIDQELEKELGS